MKKPILTYFILIFQIFCFHAINSYDLSSISLTNTKLNTFLNPTYNQHSICSIDSGSKFITVWSWFNQSNSSYYIFASAFYLNLTNIYPDILVYGPFLTKNVNPNVVCLEERSVFTITWSSQNPANTAQYFVFSKIYNLNGTIRKSEFVLSPSIICTDVSFPYGEIKGNDSFFIVWDCWGPKSIPSVKFDYNGNNLQALQYFGSTNINPTRIKMACMYDRARYPYLYEENSVITGLNDLKVGMYDMSVSIFAVTPFFATSVQTTFIKLATMSRINNTRFMIAWTNPNNSISLQVYSYDVSSQLPILPEFNITQGSLKPENPIIVNLEQIKTIAVIWQVNNSINYDLYIKCYSHDLLRVSNITMIKQIDTSNRMYPAGVAVDKGRVLLVTWQEVLNNKTSKGIWTTMIDPCHTLINCTGCVFDRDCPPTAPYCSDSVCYAIEITSVSIISSNTSILNTESLNLSIIFTASVPGVGATFAWSCMQTSQTPYTSCNDPSSIFLSTSSSISIPAINLLGINTNSTNFTITGIVSGGSNSSSSSIDLNVMRKNYFAYVYCQTLNDPACEQCIIKSSCLSKATCIDSYNACEKCYTNNECGSSLICLDFVCQTSTFDIAVSLSKTIIMDTESLNVVPTIINVVPSQIITIMWECIYNDQYFLSQYNCTDHENLFWNPVDFGVLYLREGYFNFQSDTTEFQITLNAYSSINSTRISLAFTVVKTDCNITPTNYYQSSLNYTIEAKHFNTDFYPFSPISWSISQNLPFTTTNNILFLFSNQVPLDTQESSLLIYANISNSSMTLSSYCSLIINLPPSGGTIDVSPLAGYQILTLYTVSASNWNDQHLPLTYEFSVNFVGDTAINMLSPGFTETNQYEFITPLEPAFNSIVLNLQVSDSVGAISSASKSVPCIVFSGDIFNYSALVTSSIAYINSSNFPEAEKIQIYLEFSRQINELENLYQNSSNLLNDKIGACPTCSSHGACSSSDRCNCNIDWTYFDCSIMKSKMDLVSKAKSDLIDSSNLILQDMIYKNDSALTSILQKVSQNSDFTSKEIYQKVQNVLETHFNISSPQTFLTIEQASDVSKILDSCYKYISNYDCSGNSSFSNGILSESASYIDTITRSLSKNSNASSNASIVKEDTYSLYIKKLPYCDLDNTIFSMENQSYPTIELQFNSTTQISNCSQTATVQYMTVNSNLMSCNFSAPVIFSTVAVKIYDDLTGTKIPIKPLLKITFSKSEYVVCSTSYLCTRKNLVCECSDIDLFDVKSQLADLFGKSQLKNIFKFDTLASLDFLWSSSFWILSSFLAFTIIMVIAMRFYEDYDAIRNYQKYSIKKNSKRFFLIYSVKKIISINI